MKILATGDRTWVEQKPIEQRLREVWKASGGHAILVAGGAAGVDNIAAYVARRLGFDVREYPVPEIEWDVVGPYACNLRNQRMLDREHPDDAGLHIDLCLVWHHDPGLGRGTRDMVSRVLKAQPPIEVDRCVQRRRR